MAAAPTPPPLQRTVLDQPPLGGRTDTIADPVPPPDAIAASSRIRTIADRSTSGNPMPPPSVTPVLPEPGVEERLHPNGTPVSRYAISELLGSGATSHVYAARDRSFDREVAIKFLEAGLASDGKRLARFLREARITARLDHPNIVPVYDLDVTPAGDLYLTMRRVSGSSLGDLLRAAAAGKPAPDLGDWNRRVNIILKVCDALACAHDRGIAHQDVKPDNIMIGRFGEVVLVDWGAARPFDEEIRTARITGTPAYMSPEQAAGEPADPLADIYCLGATLFHALTLRLPTWAGDDQAFWAKKRAGVVDPPTATEQALVPKRLLAIALKAMAADRAERYVSVKALAEDLQHYQAGQPVSAYRDSWLERVGRWHRAHARILWISIVAVVAVLGSAVFVYGERLKEVAAWGEPIYRQEFEDDRWRDELQVIGERSGWERRDGRLVSTGPLANFIYLPKRLYGPVAVEFEGEMLPGHPPCDLSVVWRGSEPTVPEWGEDAYLLQTGSYDNTFVSIARAGDQVKVRTQVRLTIGVRYRLRFEVDHDRLSIDLDGERICEYRAPFPCSSGYVGIYAYYTGKAFDHLAIYSKELPQRVAPTAVGDSWYQRDQPLEAAEQYRRVAEAYQGTRLGDEARYKQGLCLAKLNRRDEALALWQDLGNSEVRALAVCQRIEWDTMAGDIPGAIARFATLYRNEAWLRPRLHLVFATAIDRAMASPHMLDTERWLELTRDLLPSEPTVDIAAAQALNGLCRWEETLARYPHVETPAGIALMALARSDEILVRYPHARQSVPYALATLGRLEQCLREFPDNPNTRRTILHAQGRHAEAAAYARSVLHSHIDPLLFLGRAQEALAEAKPGTLIWYMALHHLGRTDEAVAFATAHPKTNVVPILLCARRYDEALAAAPVWTPGPRAQAHLGRWVAALERRDVRAAAQALSAATAGRIAADNDDSWMTRFVLIDSIRHRDDPAAFTSAMRALAARGPDWMMQRPWHAARLLLGEIDERTYLSQPASGHATSALHILRGVRAEMARDRAGALEAYCAYLALPLHERMWDRIAGDPITDHFVAWRVADLERAR